ncbi:hypothetical protein [Sneathiella sp.]|jgi:hypothetical protein|uniref:hypothetical protein n=1 Tax=Sneathiella sp. TaxID=1964365 RepID=UPI0039E53C17
MFDFPLLIESKDEIPAEFQPLYEHKDGKYQLLSVLSDKLTGQAASADLLQLQSAQEETLLQLEEKQAQLTGVKSRFQQYYAEKSICEALEQANGNSALLLPHLQKQLRVKEEGEDLSLEVLDHEGAPRLTDTGAPFQLPDLIEEMKASSLYEKAFEEKGVSGGGMVSSGSAMGSFSINRQDQIALNSQIEAIAAGRVSVT